VAVPVTPNDLSAAGKETCLAHTRVAKKKRGGGVIEFGGSGSAPGPIQGREWTHPKKRRRSVLATGVNKTSLPNMNW
jgi:hypothetical protein